MSRQRKIRAALIATFILNILFASPTFAAANDFYFEDFTADYYLYADENNSPRLHVKETLTAVFPETDQNHGITRTIPFLNQAGRNRTIESQDALNLIVSRNGESEPIAKIVEDDTSFTIYLGSSSKYVHGTQTYTLEYDFTNVITEFDEHNNNVSGKSNVTKAFQELYWDTNGTGWKQEFRKVTANFHIDPTLASNLKPGTWCYVGRYGESGQDRCATSQTAYGFTFSADNLTSGENLTFVVHLSPDTFKIVTKKEYILVWLFIIGVIICLIIILVKIIKWIKYAKASHDLYKSTFVSPQYLPPEDENIRVAEAEQLYVKKTQKSYVATLLELATQKKVLISKTTDEDHPRKKYWTIHLNVDPSELSPSQRKMLEILNGGSNVTQDADITVEKHHPTRWLADCADLYFSGARKVLEQHEYFIENSPSNKSKKRLSITIFSIITSVWFALFLACIPIVIAIFVKPMHKTIAKMQYADIVGMPLLPILLLLIIIFTVIFVIIINKSTKKFAPYTDQGIKMARYLEGLESYIKMAEQDRIKFLQSVDGADTTEKGIVKLYEKLLPWASLFGAEDSWLKELNRYYDIGNVTQDLDTSFIDGIVSGSLANDLTRSLQSSTNYHAPPTFSGGSGGGGWSSSDFGGGGSSSGSGSSGGGSGGGGGGGGGGGW